MLKSYLPPKFNTISFFLFFILWLFNFYLVLFVCFSLFCFLFLVLRKTTNHFRDDPVSTKGVIFAPVNGKIVSFEYNVAHGSYGEGMTEIQILVPWWKEMGIFLPLSSEIKTLFVLRGQSFFRFKKAEEVLGSKEGKGLSLSLDNKGETVGMTFFKCVLGLWPEIMVMPGDRGGRRVNIGFFPFGGTVMLYLPKKYEILVKKNDELTACETILAVIPEIN